MSPRREHACRFSVSSRGNSSRYTNRKNDTWLLDSKSRFKTASLPPIKTELRHQTMRRRYIHVRINLSISYTPDFTDEFFGCCYYLYYDLFSPAKSASSIIPFSTSRMFAKNTRDFGRNNMVSAEQRANGYDLFSLPYIHQGLSHFVLSYPPNAKSFFFLAVLSTKGYTFFFFLFSPRSNKFSPSLSIKDIFNLISSTQDIFFFFSPSTKTFFTFFILHWLERLDITGA